MFRLYKRDETGTPVAYHEVWVDLKPRRIVEHWGMIGTRGDTDTHRIKLFQGLERQIEALLAPARALGFAALDEADFATLNVVYPLGEAWREDDRDKIEAAMDALNEVLGWTGLGSCEDDMVVEDHLVLICRVVDAPMAEAEIAAQLSATEFSDYSRMTLE